MIDDLPSLRNEWEGAWKTGYSPCPHGGLASRVSQLDARALDEEIFDLLFTRVARIFAFTKNDFFETYRPELTAILRFLLWRYDISSPMTTHGAELQNLRLQDASNTVFGVTTSQKLLHGLMMVGIPWIWARIRSYAMTSRWAARPQNTWKRRAWASMNWLEILFRISSLFNLLIFFYAGKYPSLVDRLLRIQFVSANPNLRRRFHFQWLNSQLVWEGFTEFMLNIAPLFSLRGFRRLFSRITPLQSNAVVDDSKSCPLCEASPIHSPFVARPCGHRFCYVCLEQRLLSSGGVGLCECNVCGRTISAKERWNPKAKDLSLGVK